MSRSIRYKGLASRNRAHREQLITCLCNEIRKYRYLSVQDIMFCINMVKHKVKEDKL